MANNQTNRRKRDIKTKLMAAVCMLLVSSIMMVSTTYAWFTLSTAPEVKGITTAVGANGNLEMALVPKAGPTTTITSSVGDSVADIAARNITWGNLVDLGNSIYGLDKITLFPSAVNINEADKLNTTAMLKTPSYGADGRVSMLTANTVTGYYDSTESNFLPNDYYGVRAVGTASGMTDRQLDYRNARAAANTAAAQAKNTASSSLNANGSALANIAVQRAGSETATYDQGDVTALLAIVNDLLGYEKGGEHVTGALEYVETAYMQYILAYAASAATSTEDTIWKAVQAAVGASNATLTSVETALGSSLPTEIQPAITAYKATVAKVEEAKTALVTLQNSGSNTIAWADIREPMGKLADTDNMEINGIKANQITVGDNMSTLVNAVASGGLVVTMRSGGGVYADIADHCGNYSASVVIEEVTYNGMTLKKVNAKMTTATTQTTAYLDAVNAAVGVAGAPASGAAGSQPITDMYGYVIDLAFRTNAADSNLLLQVEAADRIYSDNTNEDTMGGGSSMTFASTTNDFSNDNVKALMSAIRMVFFNPQDGTIYVNGKLDVAAATIGADGVTAKIYLYDGNAEDANSTNYVKVTDGTGTHKQVATTSYVALTEAEQTSYTGTKYAQDTENPGQYVEATDGTYKQVITYAYVALTTDELSSYTGDRYKIVTGEQKATDNVILSLTQNQQTPVSVLVYLDGNNMGNDDVAATAAASMTGKMNIQFASSANLVPMEYADLHQGTGTGTTTTTTYDVTVPTGVTGEAKATANAAYTFTLADGYTLSSVTVGGTTNITDDVTEDSGTYTIPADKVTGAIVIAVTAPATT